MFTTANLTCNLLFNLVSAVVQKEAWSVPHGRQPLVDNLQAPFLLLWHLSTGPSSYLLEFMMKIVHSSEYDRPYMYPLHEASRR
jgi:hypothetical protein